MPPARSIIAQIVATDPRYCFAAAVSASGRRCLPLAEHPRLRAKGEEFQQRADIAESDGARRAYRHLAHAYRCLAWDES